MTAQGHDEIRDSSGLYVLGGMTPDERARFEEHLRECAACAAEVRSLAPLVEGLARVVPQHDPPAALRERVLRAVGGTSIRVAGDAVPFAPRSPRTRVDWSRAGWLAAAASLVLAAALGSVAWSRQQRILDLESRLQDVNTRLASTTREIADARRASDEAISASSVLAAPDLARVDLAGQPAAPAARGRAFWSRSRGLVFTASKLPPLPPGKTYQLWVLTAQTPPISAGLLSPDASGNVSIFVPTPESLPAPVAMAVTIEPAGGLPAPSGDKYLVGTPAD